jgi:hypothetical protein
VLFPVGSGGWQPPGVDPQPLAPTGWAIARMRSLCFTSWTCGWSGLHIGYDWCPSVGTGPVQHGSTATHPDAGALVGTWEDGDLRGWTRVDVLPPDGMQGVRSSNLLSSTWSEAKFERTEQRVQRQSTATAALWPPYVCSDRAASPARAAGKTTSSRRRVGGDEPATWANSSLAGPVTLAAWPPPALLEELSRGDCCRTCRWSRC